MTSSWDNRWVYWITNSQSCINACLIERMGERLNFPDLLLMLKITFLDRTILEEVLTQGLSNKQSCLKEFVLRNIRNSPSYKLINFSTVLWMKRRKHKILNKLRFSCTFILTLWKKEMVLDATFRGFFYCVFDISLFNQIIGREGRMIRDRSIIHCL